MVLSLTLPEPGNKKRVKDMIIDVLSFEWPLTLSKLHFKIKKSYKCSFSHQATYKALRELIQNKVIIKNGKEYSIDQEWVKKIKKFANRLEKNFSGKKRVPLIEGVLNSKVEKNMTVLTFNSVLEMDKAWVNIKKNFYDQLDGNEEEITFWEGNHCWWLLVYPHIEYDEMKLVKEKKVRDFCFVHNNTTLDHASKDFYKQSGVGFKTIDNPIDTDMTIFGDTIMQVSLPEDLRKKIDSFYKKFKSPSEIDIHSLLQILTTKRKVDLVITKNKQIADHLKKRMLEEFNQKV